MIHGLYCCWNISRIVMAQNRENLSRTQTTRITCYLKMIIASVAFMCVSLRFLLNHNYCTSTPDVLLLHTNPKRWRYNLNNSSFANRGVHYSLLTSDIDAKLTELNKTDDSALDISFGKEKCIYKVSVFLFGLGPMSNWRQYIGLRNAFIEGKNPSSIYYNGANSHKSGIPNIHLDCKYQKCDIDLNISDNETVLRESDAVIINLTPPQYRLRMAKISRTMLKRLTTKSKVFFYGMESPQMMSIWDPTIQDVQYHYTMTYHSTSDIHIPYGRYIKGTPTDFTDKNFAKNKTKLLVWMASNCKYTFWPRMAWVRKLSSLVNIDIYGKCGNVSCLPRMSSNCIKKQREYKFQLALENSPCEEYITEKFWVNCLLNGVVPIVYGGTKQAYESVAPSSSFIHVQDFSSHEELVDYLMLVDKRDDLYNEYFAWRRNGKVEMSFDKLTPPSLCQIIPILLESKDFEMKNISQSEYFTSCVGGSVREFSKDDSSIGWEKYFI